MSSKPLIFDKDRPHRLAWILEHLVTGKISVTVDTLVKQFKISDRTARADIATFLSLQNAWTRTPGGIAARSPDPHSYADQAWFEHLEAKQDVAATLAEEEIITPGTSLAASPGSTVALAVGDLYAAGIGCPIVTNSLALAKYAATANAQIYYVAGQYSPNINGIVGDDAVKGYEDHPCHTGLVGVSGFSFNQAGKGVLRVRHDAEVKVLRTMLECVQDLIVIVFNVHKLGMCDPWQIGTVDDLILNKQGESRKIVVVTNDFKDWKDDFKNVRERNAAEAAWNKLRQLQDDEIVTLVPAPRPSR